MEYEYYIVKTENATGGASSAKIRVSPIEGQGLLTSTKVECSRSMRKEYPVGTLFKLRAKVTSKEGGTPFLYSRHDWHYEVISETEAKNYVVKHF